MSLRDEFSNIDVRDYEARHPALFAYVKEQMAQPGKQFLLLGDRIHSHDRQQAFLNSPMLAALFNHAALPHVAVEAQRELALPDMVSEYRVHPGDPGAEEKFWQEYDRNFIDLIEHHDFPPFTAQWHNLNVMIRDEWCLIQKDAADFLRQVQGGRIGKFKTKVGGQLLGFTAAGLHVTAADSSQWHDNLVPGLAERLFLGDREVADYIESRAGGEKTAIIYGAAHFRYEGGMADRLGRTRCVHIDIYPDRATLENNRSDGLYADFMPDMVYIIDEDALLPPDPDLYRTVFDRRNDVRQKMKDKVLQDYGAAVDPERKGTVMAKIANYPGIDPQYFNYVPPRRGRSPS